MQHISQQAQYFRLKTILIIFLLNKKTLTACRNLPGIKFHYPVSYLVCVMGLATMIISSLGQYHITTINQK